MTSEPREDHASYIAGWLKALKDDNRNIFRAACYAEEGRLRSCTASRCRRGTQHGSPAGS